MSLLLSFKSKYTIWSRGVITLDKKRASKSNTLPIKSYSCFCKLPYSAPASIIATMSSVVTLSSRSAGTLNSRSTKLVTPLKNITKGVNANVTQRIMLTTLTATASGMIIANRFGIKSANKINNEVIVKNENKKLIFSTYAP